MYNGLALRGLIIKAGLTNREFQKRVFGSKKTDIFHVEHQKSVRSTTLERMRDVLKCSMDDFFTTPDWAVEKTGKVIGSNNVLSSVAIGESQVEVKHLKELLLEKDKRIETLENYINLLESREK